MNYFVSYRKHIQDDWFTQYLGRWVDGMRDMRADYLGEGYQGLDAPDEIPAGSAIRSSLEWQPKMSVVVRPGEDAYGALQ